MLALPRYTPERRTMRFMPLLLLLLLAALLSALLWPVLNLVNLVGPSTTPVAKLLNSAPADPNRAAMLFEPNAGQADPQARYLAHVPGRTHFFKLSGVTLALTPINNSDNSNRDLLAAQGSSDEAPPIAVDMNFVGASPLTTLTGDSPAAARINYFLGNDAAQWLRDLSTYTGLVYTDLYSGIDLRYEGNGRELKGTYTVAPMVDPSAIVWRYDGAESVTLDDAGNLQIRVVGAGGGEGVTLTEFAPVAWQDIEGKRIPVEARYNVAHDGNISFALGAYDRTHPLIIDPELTYSSYLGGDWADYGFGIAAGPDGSFYVTGVTDSTNLAVGNVFQPQLRGYYNAYVARFNAVGQPIYITYLGGTGIDNGADIAVDPDGNAYVTGSVSSSNFPLVNPYQSTLRGIYDAFVAKINPQGSALIWSTYLGGDNTENSQGSGINTGSIAIDSQRNVYVTGYTDSPNFPTVNALQPGPSNGLREAFVTKFNAEGGTLAWSTYLGGTGYDTAYDIDVDAAGHAYIGGTTTSSDFPIVNAYQPQIRGGDNFITKIKSSGDAYGYSTYFGGNDAYSGDTLRGLAVDAEGNAYFTGYTGSTDYPISPDAPQPSITSIMVAFISKLDVTGDMDYSTYLGGSWLNGAFSVDVDPQGRASVMGFTQSEDFPTVDPVFPTIGGIEDAFVTQMNAEGTAFNFSTFLGGTDEREMQSSGGLAVDSIGNIYVTADTQSSDFPTTANAYQPFRGSVADAFVSRFSEFTATATPTPPGVPTATPTVCPVGDYIVTTTTDAAPVRGNDYLPVSSCVYCIAPMQLPFPVAFYGQVFTQAYASSSGNLQFASENGLPYNSCLSNPEYNFTIFGYWDDIHTNVGGIYTSVTGVAPNRKFNIEWRAETMQGFEEYTNFTISLFEDGTGRVEITYNEMDVHGESATIGVQYGTGGRATQYSCNQDKAISTGTRLTFSLPTCNQPTPGTMTSTSTSTPQSGTPTATPISTETAVQTSTQVTTQTASPVSSETPGTTPTACTITFNDVPAGSTFYSYVMCLACRGVINGYPDGTFRPSNPVTRGQLAKIVAISAGFEEEHNTQTFEDAPVGSTFHPFIERLAARDIIGGYPCGNMGEPCIGPDDRPYFRPNSEVTRGQTAKIVASSASMPAPPAGSRTFEDVPEGSTFYRWVERMGIDGIIAGYPCGGMGEPCGTENRPYFRPGMSVTRGQASKIVSNTFFPECEPAR